LKEKTTSDSEAFAWFKCLAARFLRETNVTSESDTEWV
jgi:hypothetical protein